MIPAVDILQKYWGFTEFRSPQDEIIATVQQQQDVIALLPTGSGKSVCFQVPILTDSEGVCLVISPLVALMKDQVDHLQQKGIKAVAISGSLSKDDIIRIFDNLQYGHTRFLYLSPERLQSEFIQEKLKQIPLKLIAIDEAHCISEWGHDFRPSYLKLAILKELFPKINTIALTATATKRVLSDISKHLALDHPKIFKKSLTRTNLHLEVIESADKLGSLFHLIQTTQEPVIVYAGSRKNCQRTSKFLNNKGLKSVYYHAGLAQNVKEKAFTSWVAEETPIMVATNAFGMGIDKANVRIVVHISVPNSIENYVQEAGRAGRDGVMSRAVIIEEPADLSTAQNLFTKSIPNVKFIKNLYAHLNQFFQVTYGETPLKKFNFQLASFCQHYKIPIVRSYNSLQLLEREEIIKLSSSSNNFTKIKITATNERLFAYYQRNPLKEKIIKVLLRTYDGIFETASIVNLHNITKKLGIPFKTLDKELNDSHIDGIINYIPAKNNTTLQFLKPREDTYTINRIAKDVEQQQKVKIEKYQRMVKYIVNSQECRNKQLSAYFGESNTADCGICDVCKATMNTIRNPSVLKEQIVQLLQIKGELNSAEIMRKLSNTDKNLLDEIRSLLDSERIILTSQNKYKLNE